MTLITNVENHFIGNIRETNRNSLIQNIFLIIQMINIYTRYITRKEVFYFVIINNSSKI